MNNYNDQFSDEMVQENPLLNPGEISFANSAENEYDFLTSSENFQADTFLTGEDFVSVTAGTPVSPFPSLDQLKTKVWSYFDRSFLDWHSRFESIAHHFVYQNTLDAASQALLTSWGYRAGALVNGGKGFQMQAFYPVNSSNYPILAFRGSSQILDALTDANVAQIGLGQLLSNSNMISQALQELNRTTNKKVYVTGHSLGGALSQMAAAFYPSYVYKVITFQSPGIVYSWAKKVSDYNASHPDKVYAIHHRVNFDVVDLGGQSFIPGYVFKHYLGVLTPVAAHISYPVKELVKKLVQNQPGLTLDIYRESVEPTLASINTITEAVRQSIVAVVSTALTGSPLSTIKNEFPDTELNELNGQIGRGNLELYETSVATADEQNTAGANQSYEFSANEYEQSTAPNYGYETLAERFDYFAPDGDPILFYEDVKVRPGETLIGLAAEYGFDPDDWREIWKDPKNAALVAKRKLSTSLREGDILNIPIKWRIIEKKLEPNGGTFRMKAKRSGKESLRLNWVQTIYGHNQPGFPNARPFPAFSVDWPKDDDHPFYWTQAEYDHLPVPGEITTDIFRNTIVDLPNRGAPTAAQGATRWRAVTSVCLNTHKRVTIWDTFVWGINFNVDGTKEKFDIRPATKEEIEGHLNLLRRKSGRSGRSFTALGWTFRTKV